MDPALQPLRGSSFGAYEALASRGVTLMGWADPFYPDPVTPTHVKQATISAAACEGAHYTLPIGSAEFREAVARRLKRTLGVQIDPRTEICATPGSDTGLFYALRPFIVPGNGDEILVPDPSYANNFLNCALVGGVCVPVPLRAEVGFQLEIAAFEQRRTKKSKVILLTNPNNPTTTVYDRASMQGLADFAIRNDLVVVVDQAFEDLVYERDAFVMLASLSGMWERTVTVASLSKGLGLCGYRLGYILAHKDLMDVYHGAAINILGAPNTIAQRGALAALDDDRYVDGFRREYQFRALAACTALNSIPRVRCHTPESSFFVWVDVSELGTSAEIVRYLIADARVAVNPGDIFGEQGRGYVRIVTGALSDRSAFLDALERIRASLAKLCGNGRRRIGN